MTTLHPVSPSSPGPQDRAPTVAAPLAGDLDGRLVERLRARGMRVTPQRLLIHRSLGGRPQHLTAEQVLESVGDVLPGVALPTVYATLELLEELGLARRLNTGGGAVLFDSRTSDHAHLLCRRCGDLADLEEPPAPARALRRAREAGFAADHAQLVIWGLCAACQSADASE
jgi:Fe2+ or Zn2+ uptake regulation protein